MTINGHRFDNDFDSIDFITTIFTFHYQIPHFSSTANSKDRRRKNIQIRKLEKTRLHDKTLRIQKVPTLNCGFKISGDMTKPGTFYYGFVFSCVNGKTNPVLKRSGFVTNPE